VLFRSLTFAFAAGIVTAIIVALSAVIGKAQIAASAVNVLGDVHGGAGEQAVELYLEADRDWHDGRSLDDAVATTLDGFFAGGGTFVPGFGHRFHPLDPRAPRLLQLVDQAAAEGVVSGRFAQIARQVETEIQARKGKSVPMNIDGASAVIYGELGFPPALARGLFCLSRSVGILAHAWEQTQQGGRNKGPIPREMIWTYDGPKRRDLEPRGEPG
jgi:citrate synthase